MLCSPLNDLYASISSLKGGLRSLTRNGNLYLYFMKTSHFLGENQSLFKTHYQFVSNIIDS